MREKNYNLKNACESHTVLKFMDQICTILTKG